MIAKHKLFIHLGCPVIRVSAQSAKGLQFNPWLSHVKGYNGTYVVFLLDAQHLWDRTGLVVLMLYNVCWWGTCIHVYLGYFSELVTPVLVCIWVTTIRTFMYTVIYSWKFARKWHYTYFLTLKSVWVQYFQLVCEQVFYLLVDSYITYLYWCDLYVYVVEEFVTAGAPLL